MLTTDSNNNFTICYYKGKRKILKPKKSTNQPLITSFNFKHEIVHEAGLNDFCSRFCSGAELEDCTYAPLFYYFMQVVCRYLHNNTISSERNIDNVLKLAEITQPNNIDCISPFDIICDDYIKEKNDETFKHFHSLYKSQCRNVNTDKILRQAVISATNKYIQNLEATRKSIV